LTKPIDAERLIAVILPCVAQPTRNDTGAPPASAQPIDWPVLEARYTREFIARLAAVAGLTHAGTASELRSAADAGDLPTLVQLAHLLKGTAGNLAAEALKAHAAETESAAGAGQVGAADLARALADEVDRLLAALRDVASPGNHRLESPPE
jgi:HPt (histidine-containing phosphotransfer) domain-containing protein